MPGAQVASGVLSGHINTAPELPTPMGVVRADSSTSLATSSSNSRTSSLRNSSSSRSQSLSQIASSRSQHSTRPPRAAPSGPTFQIAKEKFKMPLVNVAPVANGVWCNALRGVVLDRTRVKDHPDRTLLRGYALPDPHAFMNTGSRLGTYIVSWLMIKPLWLNLATNRTTVEGHCSPYPEPQDWRDFLTDLHGNMGLGLAPSRSKESSAPEGVQDRDKRRKYEHNNARLNKFNIDTSKFTTPPDIFWRGKILLTRAEVKEKYSINETIAKEVIWELINHNFALELLALDRVLFNNLSEYDRQERDANVARCFPDSILVGLDYPTVDRGLGALRWQDRMEYVEAFRSLLSTWKGDAADELGRLGPLMHPASQHQVEAVERRAYVLYCQTFFDWFARAPTVPCRLPRH